MKDRKPKWRNTKYRHVVPEVSHQLLADKYTFPMSILFTKLLNPDSYWQNYLYMNSSSIAELQKRNLRILTISDGKRNKKC